MLKIFLFILLFFTLVFNCTVTRQPDFLGLDTIKVINSALQSITSGADALSFNPKAIGDVLKTDHLKVYINDTALALVVSNEFEAPFMRNFKIPLTVAIANESIMDEKSLGGLLGRLISQPLKVQYKDAINDKILGYSSSYSVNETQELKN